mgnify:CR=1 FL=1
MTCSVSTSIVAEPTLKTNRSVLNINLVRKNSQEGIISIKKAESKKALYIDK